MSNMENKLPEENWLIAYSSLQASDAYIVKGFLESHGIETFVKDEIVNQLQEFSYATGGVKIMVREEDYEKSVSLLKEGEFIFPPDDTKSRKIDFLIADSNTNIKVCPFCGSDNIASKKDSRFWAILVAFVTAGGPSFSSPYKVCFSCGKKWQWEK